MAVPGISEIAIGVTQGGAFGLMGTGECSLGVADMYGISNNDPYVAFDSSEVLKEKLESVRTKLNVASGAPLPIGVGFIAWILDKPSDDPRIQTVLDQKPTAIWFAFGYDLGKYIAQVRYQTSLRCSHSNRE